MQFSLANPRVTAILVSSKITVLSSTNKNRAEVCLFYAHHYPKCVLTVISLEAPNRSEAVSKQAGSVLYSQVGVSEWVGGECHMGSGGSQSCTEKVSETFPNSRRSPYSSDDISRLASSQSFLTLAEPAACNELLHICSPFIE